MFHKKLIKLISGKYRLILIRGESMLPTLRNGQITWVDYSKDALKNLKIGDVVLFKNPFGKNLIVKRIFKFDENKGFWMKGDNKNILESTDSEVFGYVKFELLKGKICIRK
ncbi:MAG: hypothetical protein CMB48_02955 [Euryarchaeota archaeon]|nr:hypothetical protein [Euryarchaeota archaeon]|tara:strand:+ start:2139 stop:2471 length:333 start_codon:yes stop_codon:yes gene_type:complete